LLARKGRTRHPEEVKGTSIKGADHEQGHWRWKISGTRRRWRRRGAELSSQPARIMMTRTSTWGPLPISSARCSIPRFSLPRLTDQALPQYSACSHLLRTIPGFGFLSLGPPLFRTLRLRRRSIGRQTRRRVVWQPATPFHAITQSPIGWTG
jgi:hypothetical protein